MIILSEKNNLFHTGWKFHLGPLPNAYEKDFDDTSWRILDLPHDYSIEQNFTHEVRGEVGHLPGGTGWYRKNFILQKKFAGKKIWIDFDGVYMDSNVFINGTFLGNYPNGYMPFSYDLTDYVICDGKTENVIAVQTTCIAQQDTSSSRWYSGAGIYRDVHLRISGPVYIPQYGVSITTPNIEEEYQNKAVKMNIQVTVKNESNAAISICVQNSFSGNVNNTIPYLIQSGEDKIIKNQIAIKDPILWSIDNPHLYQIKTEILQDGKQIDVVNTRYGFRWFRFDKNTGFSLNGKYIKLHGVCMHHDQGALGSVANETAIGRQIRILKDMGANAIRVTHNPAANVLLKQCDEQGMLVIEEAFDTWYDGKKTFDYNRFFEKPCTHPAVKEQITWAQFDIQQMVRRGKNYPSIIMWSIGNEISVTDTEKGYHTAKNLIKWIKQIDTTRPVTMGEDKFRDADPNDHTILDRWFLKVANELDVVGINCGADNYDKYRELFPNWILYGSETSSSLKSRGYYADPEKITGAQDADLYQLSSYDNCSVSWGDTATKTWILDRDRQWIAGQFIWTGFDYIGEPSPFSHEADGIPKSSYFGIIDTAGFAKDDYYLYQSQWLDSKTKPMIHIFPHWNWENEDLRKKVTIAGKIPVRVYTNAPIAELFVNDISQGEKRFTRKQTNFGTWTQQQAIDNDRLYLEWPLPFTYRPGTKIRAVAKDENGHILVEDTIVTAGKPANIRLQADHKVIYANNRDLAYITVDITDNKGNFMPTATNKLTFTLHGKGKIVGVDNGDATSWERYQYLDGVWKRKAFNGKALIITKATHTPGFFTVTVSGQGLQSNAITIQSIPLAK